MYLTFSFSCARDLELLILAYESRSPPRQPILAGFLITMLMQATNS
jgi:hypothetical protein